MVKACFDGVCSLYKAEAKVLNISYVYNTYEGGNQDG